MGASSTGPKSNRAETEGQDLENNNNEPNIFVNPIHDLNFLPLQTSHFTLMDENNNTTLINNNSYMTVSLSPSSTTLTTTYKKQALQQIQLAKKEMLDEKPMKKVDVKSKKEKEKEKEKKKKKEKPKAPRQKPARGGRGGEQQQMARKTPRKTQKKDEK
jgi:hypothetical protein